MRAGREKQGGRAAMPSSSRRVLAAVAVLAATAALASVAVVRLGGGAETGLLSLSQQQERAIAAEAMTWFRKEHPRTGAIIGNAELAKDAARTTAEMLGVKGTKSFKPRQKLDSMPPFPIPLPPPDGGHIKQPSSSSLGQLPAGWYKGAVSLSSKEWDQRLQGFVVKANAVTLAKVVGHALSLAEPKEAPQQLASAEETLENPVQFAAALQRQQLLPMSAEAASAIKCDDHEDCLLDEVYSRFLPAGEQGTGCPLGAKCELHQVWLTCGGKHGVCPLYLYALTSEAALTTHAAAQTQQLQGAEYAPSLVLDQPLHPAVDAKELHEATGRSAVWAGSAPSDYNQEHRGEFATGDSPFFKENTETYHEIHENTPPHKLPYAWPRGELHAPEGKWATRLPSDDNKKARTWYPTRVQAEKGRGEADGMQDAGTLRWKKKIVVAKGFPEQDGFHYLGGYADARTDEHKLADSGSGKGLSGVNVYASPLDERMRGKHANYWDTVRRVDRSDGSRGVHAAATDIQKVADGAKGFVYSSDSNILAKESYEDDAKKKARVQGLNVYDDSLFDGVPNPFGEIMKGSHARKQQLAEFATLSTRARTNSKEHSGLSSLLTPRRMRRRRSHQLTAQQRAVLQADSAALAAHFFGKADAKRMTSALRDGRGLLAEGRHTAHPPLPAMAAAGMRSSNERGGLLSAADDDAEEEEGVESPEATRRRKMRRAAAGKVVPGERADAREMREKREQRTKAAASARAREMRSREGVRARGAKVVASSSSSVHVTEEGERLAAAARHYVHALQDKESGFERTAEEQAEAERRMLQQQQQQKQQRTSPHPARARAARPQARARHGLRHPRAQQQQPQASARHATAATASRAADELGREERRLEAAAIKHAAQELGLSKRVLRKRLLSKRLLEQRRVRARLVAHIARVRHRARARPPASFSKGSPSLKMNMNMVGAHRQVGPHNSQVVDEGALQGLDQLLFGKPAGAEALVRSGNTDDAQQARLPGVHLWGLSMSPDLSKAATAAWKSDLREMHRSHVRSNSNLREGLWSGEEGASMQAARTQMLAQLASAALPSRRMRQHTPAYGVEATKAADKLVAHKALPSSVRYGSGGWSAAVWPGGHRADARVDKAQLVADGGADDYSESGLLHAESLTQEHKFAHARKGDDVRAPCDGGDSPLCAEEPPTPAQQDAEGARAAAKADAKHDVQEAAAPKNKSARKETAVQVKSAVKSASKSNKEREAEGKSTSKYKEAAADKSKSSKENEAEADTAHDKSAKKAAREDVFYQDEEEKEDLEAEEEETGLAPGTLSSAALPKERMRADDLQELSEAGRAHLRVAKSRSARARAHSAERQAERASRHVPSVELASMRKATAGRYEQARHARGGMRRARLEMASQVTGQVRAKLARQRQTENTRGERVRQIQLEAEEPPKPPKGMEVFTPVEPSNHVSGEYKAPVYPLDPVRAHYRKRLEGGGKAMTGDDNNDDIVEPIQSRNRIESPTKPRADFQHTNYTPHAGFDPEDAAENTEPMSAERNGTSTYPHLVRWDKAKWKEAAEIDAERAELAKYAPDEDDGDTDGDGIPDEEDEDGDGIRDQEIDEKGLRPAKVTVKTGRHAKQITWAGIARARLNDTLSGVPDDGGNYTYVADPFLNREGKVPVNPNYATNYPQTSAENFKEYRPKNVLIKSLDGYYKRTPDKYLDFEGVHPWSNTQDRQNKDTLNYQGQTLPRDVADVPDEDFGKQMDSNTDEGHLPGVLLDSWGAVDADVRSKPSASNEFVPSEPASVRIEKEHHVIISDQDMNEGIGTGGLVGRDQGAGTDDSYLPGQDQTETARYGPTTYASSIPYKPVTRLTPEPSAPKGDDLGHGLKSTGRNPQIGASALPAA